MHIQTAKMQLAMPVQKMQKEACAGRGTDFLLGGNAEERNGSFFCIPAVRRGGDEWETNGENLNIARHGMVLSENHPVLFLYPSV